MAKEKANLFSLNTQIEEDFGFDLNTNKEEEKEEEKTFELDTYVSEDTDDFFHQFNKPTEVTKKKTKQEMLHEFKKINTKMSPELHKMLKVYCSQEDLKKNDVFKEAVEIYMNKFQTKDIVFTNEINGMKIDIDLSNNIKKSYNFEVRKKFFTEVKTFASKKDVKLVQMYEQAIVDYLHEKRFSI